MGKRARGRVRDRKRAGSNKRDKESRGGRLTTIRVPDGIEIFRPEDKTYRLDVLLYTVGKGNPYAEEGESYYERTFWVHRVGADNKYRICPLKTCGKPCPICEDRAEMARDPDGDEDLISSLRPSQRQVWLLHDREDDEAAVKLFEFSWWNFGRTLDELRQDADEDEVHITDFDDPDAGSTLRVKFSKNPPYGFETRSIEFRPRTKPVPDEWLEHGICLDSLLIIPDYEDLRKEYLQIDPDAKEDEEKDKKPSSQRRRSDDDDDKKPDNDWMEEGTDAIHDEIGRVEITSLNRTKTKAKVEDSDGDIHTVETADLNPVPANACKACRGTGKSSKGGKCKPCEGTGVKQDSKPKDDDGFDEDDIPFDDAPPDEGEKSNDDDDDWDDDGSDDAPAEDSPVDNSSDDDDDWD